ncbi:MAG: CBS domain-containing protein [Candidatus Omnitrophota bacterium]
MQIKDIMLKGAVISVRRSTTLRSLIDKFKTFHTFPLVPVVDADMKLIGVVYFNNLIDIFKPSRPAILKTIPFLDEEEENLFDSELTSEMGPLILVEDIMEDQFMSVSEDMTVDKVYDLMKLHNKEQLPVVNKDGQLVGMIGVFDIVLAVFRDKGIV